MEPTVSFGEWIQHRRTDLHLTQSELARQVYCSPIMIRKIEADARRPSPDMTRHLAQVLQIPPDLRPRFMRVARGELSPDHLPLLEADRKRHGHWLPVLSRADLAMPNTSFLGRVREIAQVCERLQQPETRLLTLVGPPGIGKSRLSLHVAAELGDAFLDGVHFVPLAPLRDPALAPDAVAQIFGFAESSFPTPLDFLKAELRQRHLLLVLDNFEQILPARNFLQELLHAAPHIKMLVTSRTALSIAEEEVIQVAALALPTDEKATSALAAIGFPAVQLLVTRARAANPTFTLTSENARAAVALCTRLDGLPLAIELAAPRLTSLSLAEMLAALSDRMALAADSRDQRPERHHTLRSAIAWSIDLLSTAAQKVYARLGVFVHGATLEAAEVVCNVGAGVRDDIRSQMTILVNHNLVRAEDSTGVPRYTMLETILEYARELLAARHEEAAVRRAHAEYFCDFMENAAPKILGVERHSWLERVEQENDNLRAALNWAKEVKETRILTRLVAALGWFWEMQGRRIEARLWVDYALSTPAEEQPPAARVKLLQMAGAIANEEGDLERSRCFNEESLALAQQAGDLWTTALAQRDLSWVYFVADNDADKARLTLELCIPALKAAGDLRNYLLSLLDIGMIDHFLGDATHGIPYAQEALRLAEAWNDAPAATEAKSTLGLLAHSQGDDETSIRILEELVAASRHLPNGKQIAWQHYQLAIVLLECGYLSRAYEHFGESSRLWQERGEPLAVAFCESGEANALFRQGDLLVAKEAYLSTLATYVQFDSWRGIAWSYCNLAHIAAIQGDVLEAELLLEQGHTIFINKNDHEGIEYRNSALQGVWKPTSQPRRR